MARGTVVRFDDPVGIGEVEDAASGQMYPFHCTAIADQSRTIEVGADVTFAVVPGHLGRWEATDITPATG